MISHRNVISNVMQICTYEKHYREFMRGPNGETFLDISLGLLPQSHIYGLVVGCHCAVYRGDQVINLPKFEIKSFLNAIQTYKINTLILVSALGKPLVISEDDAPTRGGY